MSLKYIVNDSIISNKRNTNNTNYRRVHLYLRPDMLGPSSSPSWETSETWNLRINLEGCVCLLKVYIPAKCKVMW